MPNYNNGKIYSIRSHQTEQIYIGSTTQPLSKRLYEHRQKYRRYKNTGKGGYITSFEILQHEDHYIELVEDCPCDTRQQLVRREGQVIREYNCVNKLIAGRTKKQYREDNKDKIKQYCEDNKDKIKQYKKQHYQKNKEKYLETGRQHYQKNKEKYKENSKRNYQKNKEKIALKREKNINIYKEKWKQYYDNNKDRLNDRKREKITCECGSTVRKDTLARHKRSKKHQRWVEENNN